MKTRIKLWTLKSPMWLCTKNISMTQIGGKRLKRLLRTKCRLGHLMIKEIVKIRKARLMNRWPRSYGNSWPLLTKTIFRQSTLILSATFSPCRENHVSKTLLTRRALSQLCQSCSQTRRTRRILPSSWNCNSTPLSFRWFRLVRKLLIKI